MKFKIKKDWKERWEFVIEGDNGLIITESERTYSTKRNCKNAIDLIRKQAKFAEVVEEKD